MKVKNVSTFLAIVIGIFVVIFLFHNQGTSSAEEFTNMSAKETHSLINQNKGDKDIVVLDIRTPDEFAAGHIENAVNIDYFSPNFQSQLDQLDKGKTYVMHCKSGGRSGRSVSIFKELNFKNLIHMNGGFDEWVQSGLPVVK